MKNLRCKKCNCFVSEDSLIIEAIESRDLMSTPDYNEVCPECNEVSIFEEMEVCDG